MNERMKRSIRKFLGMADSRELKSAVYDYSKSLERIKEVVSKKKVVNGKPRKTKQALLLDR